MIPIAPVWWKVQNAPYPRLPKFSTRADVVVIGGGLTGLSAAYHLLGRRPGASLVVLEANRIGAGASGRSSGMLGPGVGQSLAALVRSQGAERARALYMATLEAVEDVRHLVERERIDCELEMNGHLVVARTPAGEVRLGALIRLMAEFDLPCEMLDDEMLGRRICLVRRHGGAGPAGLLLPVAGTLHPMRLLLGLADRVIARGGSIFEGARVTAIHGRQPLRLTIEGGTELIADEVVVATGGYTPGLGLMRGRILPIHLQVAVTEPLSPCARKALGWKDREGIIDNRRIFNYFRLTADDRIIFGGGAPRYAWGGATAESLGSAAALDQLTNELRDTFPPEASLRAVGGWTGVVDYVVDTLPAIARFGGRPALLHAVGWCGHGIALSVASGAWITQILCDGTARENLPWFRDQPARIPFEPLRWTGFHAGIRAFQFQDRSL